MNDKDKLALRDLDITDKMIKQFARKMNDNVFLRIIVETDLEKKVFLAVISAILDN